MEGGISEEEKTKLGIRGRERGGALHMKEGDKGKRIGRGGSGNRQTRKNRRETEAGREERCAAVGLTVPIRCGEGEEEA